jgi:hypothetical protein
VAKTIILHIGANKTGSSAIQAFLKANAQALPKFGVTVGTSDLAPGSAVTGEHVWYVQSVVDKAEEGRKTNTRKIDAIMAGLPDSAKLVLSAENLSNKNNSHLLFSDLAARYAIEVIFYIRRQDEYLLSSWQQWYGKISDDFWAWAISVVGQFGNWRASLEAWETIIPRKNIKVRIYERNLLVDRDINADFVEQLGLAEHKDKLAFPNNLVNPSYSDAVIDLVKGNKQIFEGIHDNGFYNLVRELTGNEFFKRPKESPITLQQRLAIVQRYQGSNAWVRDAYFPAKKGQLFTPPGEHDYQFISKDDIEAEKWKLMASLIYGLAKRDAKEKSKKK